MCYTETFYINYLKFQEIPFYSSHVFFLQEYVLAHTEMPTTLEGAEGAIKKQEDFMTTMDANEEKINGVVEAGRRLASDGNINAEKIQERATSIDDRLDIVY